jgi:DNA-binding winged helix-turn-helix (wHTH) protein
MRFRFGAFELDTSAHCLTKDGRTLELSPKAYALLEILMQARPAAVSKETLYDRLWPKTFVEPGNLHNVVSEVRSACGDDERSIIRTVRGFGYAFAAEKSGASEPASFAVQFGAKLVRLHQGENIIGRDPDAAVVIDSPDVSRRHARLILTGDAVTLEDLGSKNGTFVKGERVTTATVVGDGDEVTVGRTLLVLQRTRDLASTSTAT